MAQSIKLSNPALLQSGALINGTWSPGKPVRTFPVKDPASGNTILEIIDCSKADASNAILAASSALPSWKAKPAAERSIILRKWSALILTNKEDLATILSSEQGKPLAEARGEVNYGASFIEWFAEEGKRIYGDVIPSTSPDKRITVIKEAVGVVAAISPWNFPIAMITRKVAPALAAGCTAVVKPSEDTPLSALALGVLAVEAGIPAGVLNILPASDPEEIGHILTQSKVVRKISFTGSTAVGKILMRQSADTLKKLSLELGGNAPFIVFDDADIAGAVAGAMSSKFRNAGQTCICPNRFFVQDGVYEEFVNQLRSKVKELKVGPGTTADVDIGPLINAAAVQKVTELIDDAVANGATLYKDANFTEVKGNFFPPCVLTGVTNNMKICREEIFGPVVVIMRFTDEEEAIELANDTDAGLAAYFYGRDYARIWRVAEALEYGMVGINTGSISTAVAPFGGVKESGFGREGSKYGIEEYITTKYLCWQL